MHYNTIYNILNNELGRIKNRNPDDIYAEHNLKTVLRFNARGLIDLAQKLTDAFSKAGHPLKPPLASQETANAKTVRDLKNLIEERLCK